jgi:hypothetical protein
MAKSTVIDRPYKTSRSIQYDERKIQNTPYYYYRIVSLYIRQRVKPIFISHQYIYRVNKRYIHIGYNIIQYIGVL